MLRRLLLLLLTCAVWTRLGDASELAASIQKRDYVLDCGTEIPASYQERYLRAFGTFTALCGSYPNGVGVTCVNGEPEQRRPHAILADAGLGYHPWLYVQCLLHCTCLDIAPHIPRVIPSNPATRCRVQEDDDGEEVTSPPESTCSPQELDPEPSQTASIDVSPVECSDWYGRPRYPDCMSVLNELMQLDQNPTAARARQFAQSARRNRQGYMYVQPPITVTSGTCVASIWLQDSANGDSWGLATWFEMYMKLYEVVAGCVDRRGVGGMNYQSTIRRGVGYHAAVYSPGSRFDQFFKLKFATAVTMSGGLIIRPFGEDTTGIRTSSSSMSEDTSGTGATSPQGVANGKPNTHSNQQCGNTCYSNKDCDVENNCICAQKDNTDWPLSPSWGTFACIYVANAVAAVAAVTQYNSCQGRCLLGTDGSIFIDDVVNATAGSSGNPAGDAAWNVTEIAASFYNGSQQPAQGSSLAVNSSVVLEEVDPEQTMLPIPDSALSGSNSAGAVTIEDMPDSPTTSFAQNSSQAVVGLICPCNCTYISAACCFSPYVSGDIWAPDYNSSSPFGTWSRSCLEHDSASPDNITHIGSTQWLGEDTEKTHQRPDSQNAPASLGSKVWSPLNQVASLLGGAKKEPNPATCGSACQSSTDCPISCPCQQGKCQPPPPSSSLSSSSTSISPSQTTFVAPKPALDPSSPSPDPSPVCKSINSICWSFWGCGDSTHCFCGILATDSLLSKCLPKAGFGPSSSSLSTSSPAPGGDKMRRKRQRIEFDNPNPFHPRPSDKDFDPTTVFDPVPNSNVNSNPFVKARDDDSYLMTRDNTVGEILACPCNCTYTSLSCCSSPNGQVWEDPQVYGKGALGNVQGYKCDLSTGEMIPS